MKNRPHHQPHLLSLEHVANTYPPITLTCMHRWRSVADETCPVWDHSDACCSLLMTISPPIHVAKSLVRDNPHCPAWKPDNRYTVCVPYYKKYSAWWRFAGLTTEPRDVNTAQIVTWHEHRTTIHVTWAGGIIPRPAENKDIATRSWRAPEEKRKDAEDPRTPSPTSRQWTCNPNEADNVDSY